MEVHLIVNSNVFYNLFATNKSISACILHDTRSHHANRGQSGCLLPRPRFKRLHNIVLIVCLFAAIKIHIFKIKVVRVKLILFKL